jgi:hypothetical protein
MTDYKELLKPTIEELCERAGTYDCDYMVKEAAAEWIMELQGKLARYSTATGVTMVYGEVDRLRDQLAKAVGTVTRLKEENEQLSTSLQQLVFDIESHDPNDFGRPIGRNLGMAYDALLFSKGGSTDPWKAFIERTQHDLDTAIEKEAEDLTESERLAICVAAGSKVHTVLDDNNMLTFKTANPCAVVKIDGKFQVHERQDT